MTLGQKRTYKNCFFARFMGTRSVKIWPWGRNVPIRMNFPRDLWVRGKTAANLKPTLKPSPDPHSNYLNVSSEVWLRRLVLF